jgi:hypothetical protein
MIIRAFFALKNRSARLTICKTILLCLATAGSDSMAQSILTPPPPGPTLIPPAVQDYQTSHSDMQVFAPSATLTDPFTYGPASLHPHVDYQFLYGNGIESSPGQSGNTIAQIFSPGMTIDLGPNLTLDYTATLNFYSSRQLRNTVDNSAILNWGTTYGSWFFGLSQSFADSSDPNVETASQTSQQTYSTALNASYQFNDQLVLNMSADQILYYTGNGSTNLLLSLANSRSWSTTEGLSYIYAPRLNFGISAGFGYNQQDNSPDAINEQYQGTVNWRPTDAISFQLSGGLEEQQYLSGGASDLLTPIFGASVQYQPFEHTQIGIAANRTVSRSSFANQTTEGTSITANLNQRLLGRFFLNLGGGYTSSKYIASLGGFSAGRNDDTYNFTARLTSPFIKRGNISVFYSYSKNVSSQTGFASGSSAFGYSSNQVGFEVGFRY